MKTPTEALLVVAVLFAQGCVERTDLSPVYEETATRSEIEAVLGEPVACVRLVPYGDIRDARHIRPQPGGYEVWQASATLAWG